MAGNNNLYAHMEMTLKEGAALPPSPNLTITAHIDSFARNSIERAVFENSKRRVVEYLAPDPSTISGTYEGLVRYLEWHITNYPADELIVSIWGHGAPLDPRKWGRAPAHTRGVAFNNSYREYLTDPDLGAALQYVSTHLLGGKKIFVIFDACHMGNFGNLYEIAPACSYVIASEEFIWAPGLNYTLALMPIIEGDIEPRDLARSIITSSKEYFRKKTAEYTFSALDASAVTPFGKYLNTLGALLSKLILGDQGVIIREILNDVLSDPLKTTWFYNNNAFDIDHFLYSLIRELKPLAPLLGNDALIDETLTHLYAGFNLLQDIVIAQTNGPKIPRARGLSIYFSRLFVHTTFYKTRLARECPDWRDFLGVYTQSV